MEMLILCCPARTDSTIRDIVSLRSKGAGAGRGVKRGFGVVSQQTGELAGIFYCFLWRRTTSSSSVCAASQVCCSRPQISVLKHMRQTALGNGRRPLQALLTAFWFFPSLILFILIFSNTFSRCCTWMQIQFVAALWPPSVSEALNEESLKNKGSAAQSCGSLIDIQSQLFKRTHVHLRYLAKV